MITALGSTAAPDLGVTVIAVPSDHEDSVELLVEVSALRTPVDDPGVRIGEHHRGRAPAQLVGQPVEDRTRGSQEPLGAGDVGTEGARTIRSG